MNESTSTTEPLHSYSLAGRTAIVTGAARGIGRACALRLAGAGANVIIVDRDLEGAKQFGEVLSATTVMEEVEALGVRSRGFEIDLVDADAVRAMTEAVAAEFGSIDILVNMAGGMITDVATSTPSIVSAADMLTHFEVNLMTAVNCSQAVVPFMPEGGGSIVNVTGASAIATYPGGSLAPYGAAKLAVLHYTRSLAMELGPRGIRANCVSPGITYSSRIASQAVARGVGTDDDKARIPLQRFGQPDDIASAVEFLAGDMASYITGQCLSVCGGVVMTPN